MFGFGDLFEALACRWPLSRISANVSLIDVLILQQRVHLHRADRVYDTQHFIGVPPRQLYSSPQSVLKPTIGGATDSKRYFM